MFDWVLNTLLKLKTMKSELRHSRYSGAFTVDLEHILRI